MNVGGILETPLDLVTNLPSSFRSNSDTSFFHALRRLRALDAVVENIAPEESVGIACDIFFHFDPEIESTPSM